MPEFETTGQGSRVATSVGGVLTGRDADIIFIDDPLKPEEVADRAATGKRVLRPHALQPIERQALGGAIVLIMHRLREDKPEPRVGAGLHRTP